jgi:hypothetical protein
MLPEPLNTIKKKPLPSLYIAGAIVLLVGGLVWCTKVSTNVQRVFWGTVSQSLSTSAVTITSKQTNGSASLNQAVQYSFGPNSVSHTLSTLKQNGTTVVDELIGTPSADYTRYLSVDTTQKSASGKLLDFSNITGVWAKSDPSAGKPQLFSQSVLGTSLPIGGIALPIGNLSEANRIKLIQEIKNDAVYQVDFKNVTKQRVSGREQYVYNIGVQPVAYAALMQRFAQLMGLHDLDGLDPSSFKGQAALKLQLTIDVRSRHVVTATAGANGDEQSYTSYDIPADISAPAKAISIAELQARLSKLQQ